MPGRGNGGVAGVIAGAEGPLGALAGNAGVGSWLGKWHVKDRIVQGDKFRVNLFDGPVVTIEDPVEEPVR